MSLHTQGFACPDFPQEQPPQRLAARRRSQDAFSLVEIVMAIGVVAFAFVAIFGLVPVGLNTFRSAMDTSVRSQIAQRVVFEAQQTDPKTLESQANEVRYFDDEGTEVQPTEAIYNSMMTLLPETPLPDTAISQNVMTLTVKIVHNPAQLAEPFGEESKLNVTTHSAYIARSAK